MTDKDHEGPLAAFEPHLAHVVVTQNSTARARPPTSSPGVVAREVFGDDRVTVRNSPWPDAIDEAAGRARNRQRRAQRGRRAGHRLWWSPSARPGCSLGGRSERPGTRWTPPSRRSRAGEVPAGHVCRGS